MTRKRKSKFTATEWRRLFAEAAKYCSEYAKRRGIRFQDCIKQYLKKF
jgi:hypothetical protein